MEAMSELLRTEACWPAWLVLGGPLEGMLASPRAAPKLFSSRLQPACMPKNKSNGAVLHMQDRTFVCHTDVKRFRVAEICESFSKTRFCIQYLT